MLYFATRSTVDTMPTSPTTVPVIQVKNVSVRRETRTTVDNVSLTISPGEHWVILGPNGCGKTTLLQTMSLYLHPSSGDVIINGQMLGTFDIRPVRPRLAYVSASLASELRTALTAHEVVLSAKHGALEVWWNEYSPQDHQQADACLHDLSVSHLASTPIAVLSSGELQRVLMARALMSDPLAVLLDEPTARLDLGGREHVVRILDEFSQRHPELPTVTVTHHVDEIPMSTTHCALMQNGKILSSGTLTETLTSQTLSECFAMPLVVETRPNGRLGAYAP